MDGFIFKLIDITVNAICVASLFAFWLTAIIVLIVGIRDTLLPLLGV